MNVPRALRQMHTHADRGREREIIEKKSSRLCACIFIFYFFFYFFTFFDARFLQARSNSESERKSLLFEIICSLDE